MITATVSVPVHLDLLMADGNTGVFPQATIYDSANTVVTTLNLTHIAQALYSVNWTPAAVGDYILVYVAYADAGHTVPILSGRTSERVQVFNSTISDIRDMLARVLGLEKENSYIDNTTYNANSRLLTSRVRCFDNPTHCNAATDGGSETTGLVASYDVNVEYETDNKTMKTYKMVRTA